MSRLRIQRDGGDQQYLITTLNLDGTTQVRKSGPWTIGTTKTMVDSPNSGPWPPKAGHVKVTGMSVTTETWTDTSAGFTSPAFYQTSDGQRYWGPASYSGPYWSPEVVELTEPDYFAGDASNATDFCINGAFADLYGSVATGLVTLGELRKTASMFKDPFKRATDLIRSMGRRKSDSRSASDTLQAFGGTWLEWRMGWMPLLHDIRNTMKAIDDLIANREPKILRAKRSHKLQWRGEDVYVNGVPFFGTKTIDRSCEYEQNVGAVLFAKETLSMGSTYKRASVLGLAAEDVLPAVWELIPYSFLIDRFLQVQDWLVALQGRVGVEFLGGYSFSKIERKQVYRLSCSGYDVPDTTVTPTVHHQVIPPPGMVQHVRNSYTRSPVGAPTQLPAVNPRQLSLNQHVDHVALVVNGLASLLKR